MKVICCGTCLQGFPTEWSIMDHQDDNEDHDGEPWIILAIEPGAELPLEDGSRCRVLAVEGRQVQTKLIEPFTEMGTFLLRELRHVEPSPCSGVWSYVASLCRDAFFRGWHMKGPILPGNEQAMRLIGLRPGLNPDGLKPLDSYQPKVKP